MFLVAFTDSSGYDKLPRTHTKVGGSAATLSLRKDNLAKPK